MTNDEIIAWLENNQGCALISDDNGHWACTMLGTQNVVFGKEPADVDTSFWIKKEDWRNSIREAVEAAAGS